MGLVFLLTLSYFLVDVFFLESWLFVAPWVWYLTALTTFLAFAMAIPRKFYDLNTLKAVLTLPKAFAVMFLSLFKLKGANKKFIHTEHGTVNS